MSRRVSTIVLLALTGTCLGTHLNAQQDLPGEQAMELARQAARADKAGHEVQAYLLYSEASALQPKKRTYRRRMESLQSRAALEARSSPAAETTDLPPEIKPSEAPPELNPADTFDSVTERELAAQRRLREPPALQGPAGTKDFDLNGPPRSLFDQVAKAFGFETLYDGDYPPGGGAIRFQVTDVDYRHALHDLEAATNSFVVPIAPRLFMVAQDTPSKRNDLEQTVSLVIPVPSAVTPQELTEIGQAVKQAFNIDKISWNTQTSEIVIRDRISRARPAAALLNQLLGYRPEVMLELEYLEVTDSDLKNYGFTVTNNFSLIYLGSILNNVTSIPSAATGVLTFGGGKMLFGFTVAQVQSLFNESTSKSRQLFRTQLRAQDGQAATFHSGEKYPIVTSTFSGAQTTGTTTAGSTTSALQTAPSYTFEDLGVVVEAKPHIHGAGEVTLELKTNFEVLTGTAINNIPVLGQRQTTSTVRVRDGEWTIIGGMSSTTDSKSTTGFLGLSGIPLLGNLFKQVSTDKEGADVLIGVRPVLLSLPPSEMPITELAVGTETRPLSPL